MSLEQSVQLRWAEDAELTALIAPGRVFTARSAETVLPRAVVAVVRSKPLWLATGNPCWEEQMLRITVEDSSYDRVATIGDRLMAVFDRASWAADTGLVVARMTCLRRGPILAVSPFAWRQRSEWSALLRIVE